MSVRTINAEELERMLERAQPTRLVNVLRPDSFERVHIPGSENVPRGELDERAAEEFDRSETIVVYCADEDCHASPKAAAKPREMGYERVYDFAGGIAEWRRGRSAARSG